MTTSPETRATAFAGDSRVSAGLLRDVAITAQELRGEDPPVMVFDDTTGQVIELDLRGTREDLLRRLEPSPPPPRGRGRPRLGVIGREVTLMPAHWDWLGAQPGGASVALRRLIEDARKDRDGRHRERRAHEVAYRVMAVLAGDRPGFEEAARALFAHDAARFATQTAAWPGDIRDYVTQLAFPTAAAAAAAARYLEPTEAAGRALFLRRIRGPVVMLNLLRFRAVADYSASPELAPPSPISGADAFQRYIEHTRPRLEASGGEILFVGRGGASFIGPTDERWDLAMLIRQHSVESFFAFATDPAYLAGLGHRTAALEDSRLVPLEEDLRA